jgi:hypothetical protein
MGQFWPLQVPVIEVAGHAMPPFCGCTMTKRDSEVNPPPQETLQGDWGPQAPTWQSTGHTWLLQS